MRNFITEKQRKEWRKYYARIMNNELVPAAKPDPDQLTALQRKELSRHPKGCKCKLHQQMIDE